MTNENPKGDQRAQIRAIDEARYLLNAFRPKTLNLREPTPEEMADFLIDMVGAHAEVDLSDVQRVEAINVFRSLPADDATLEQFAKGCERSPSLAQLCSSLRGRLAQPHTLMSDPLDGFGSTSLRSDLPHPHAVEVSVPPLHD